MKNTISYDKFLKSVVFGTVLVVAAGLVFAPLLSTFNNSLSVLKSVSILPIVTSVIVTGLTFLIASTTYHMLARKSLQFHRTVLVSIANMFTGRLLPAGAGGIATFYLYLRHEKHTVSQASSVVAANNLLGFVSHAGLLIILFVLSSTSFEGFAFPRVDPKIIVGMMLVVIVLTSIIGFRKKLHNKVTTVFKKVVKDLGYYRQHPSRIGGGIATSTLLTICNATILWLCVLSVHGKLSLLAALAVFSIGIVASTLTPTPGGLGGIEAGLLAGLIGYQIPSQVALAAVVLFRLVSYWLTLALGAAVYAYILKRGYLHVAT